jgi:hypothetical protein
MAVQVLGEARGSERQGKAIDGVISGSKEGMSPIQESWQDSGDDYRCLSNA